MTVLYVLAGLTIGLSYIYLLGRRGDLGLISLLVVDLYYVTFGLSQHLIGGLHLDPHDVAVFCLLAADGVGVEPQ